MSIFKLLKNITLSVFITLLLLPVFIYAQQPPSIDSTSWILASQNKKDTSLSIAIFFLKNNEACVMFQNSKASAWGLLPVMMGKRPLWTLKGAEYSIKFRDRDFAITGKILSDNSITAVTKGEDNLLESKNGFSGESVKDPKLTYDKRNFLVPFLWLTATPAGKPKWLPAIKAQGLDLCNPMEDANNQTPWFPPA